VAALYERATQFASAEFKGFNRQDMFTVELEAQLVGDKAGTRFAEAATALVAGDQPLYRSWLQAAEATARLVAELPRRGLRTTDDYSTAALDAADQLAAVAVASVAT
jgi:hypothetical protein